MIGTPDTCPAFLLWIGEANPYPPDLLSPAELEKGGDGRTAHGGFLSSLREERTKRKG
jgi:hypothetical protein